MGLDREATEREPQPAAAARQHLLPGSLDEPLEDLLALIGGDAATLIADAQLDAILLGWGFIGDFNADQHSHGTPGQRRFALGLGFNGGEDAPDICIDEYWPDGAV